MSRYLKKSRISIWVIIILVLGACKASKTTTDKEPGLAYYYQQGIQNAMSPGPNKVCTSLVAINQGNPDLIHKMMDGEDYILVLTWKKDTTYYVNDKSTGFYNTANYPIWVTTAPELKKRMEHTQYHNLDLRLEQLLGLPPDSGYPYFIEIWVKPQDLFRPCPDKEISDNKCELCFTDETDTTHISWINALRLNSYYSCPLYDKYPWTQLGYTYDWNPSNKSHVGLSEFVIGKNKNIKIHKVYTTSDYINQP